jgi:hypothetical protein
MEKRRILRAAREKLPSHVKANPLEDFNRNSESQEGME